MTNGNFMVAFAVVICWAGLLTQIDYATKKIMGKLDELDKKLEATTASINSDTL